MNDLVVLVYSDLERFVVLLDRITDRFFILVYMVAGGYFFFVIFVRLRFFEYFPHLTRLNDVDHIFALFLWRTPLCLEL